MKLSQEKISRIYRYYRHSGDLMPRVSHSGLLRMMAGFFRVSVPTVKKIVSSPVALDWEPSESKTAPHRCTGCGAKIRNRICLACRVRAMRGIL